MLTVECPNCRKRLTLKGEMKEKKGRCPSCGQVLLLRDLASEPTPPPIVDGEAAVHPYVQQACAGEGAFETVVHEGPKVRLAKATIYVVCTAIGLLGLGVIRDTLRPSAQTPRSTTAKVRTRLDEEKQLNHFLNALEYYGRAGQIAKESQSSGPMDQKETEAVLLVLNASLRQSKLVKDAVLAKLHPDLPHHFRNEFVLAVERSISGIETSILNPEKGAPDERRAYFELQAAWVKWFGEVGKSFTFPQDFSRKKPRDLL